MSTEKSLNPWNYKPWWCQPWSILLTGIIIVAASWGIAKSVWLTALISLPIILWWLYFLVIWPNLIRRSGILENNQQPAQDSTS